MTLKGVTMSTTRIQLALNVDDVSGAVAFYEKMFGAAWRSPWSLRRR